MVSRTQRNVKDSKCHLTGEDELKWSSSTLESLSIFLSLPFSPLLLSVEFSGFVYLSDFEKYGLNLRVWMCEGEE